jgi:PhnB protein
MPQGQTKLTPYLCFKDTAGAIEFYKKAFGAEEAFRLAEPSGRVGHAEVTIGGARFMLSDEYPDFGAVSAQSMGGCPITLHLSVDNVDTFVDRAVKAGATLLRPVKDEFFGDRMGQVADPFGYKWMIGTPKENVSPQEMQKRWSKMLAG